MDVTERKITKIARELSAFTVQTMKADGVGTAGFDSIHLVRHNPGITQAEICDRLRMDKGAAARRAANLGGEGLSRSPVRRSRGRSQQAACTPTEKAESLKNSKARIEAVFYEWLIEELPRGRTERVLRNARNAVPALQA